MTPRIKFGLITGVAGLLLNICVATMLGICGPFVGLLAGAVAGLVTGLQEKLPTRRDGAIAGAVSGGIAGALVLVGQLIGAFGALALLQNSEVELPFGQIPGPQATDVEQFFFFGGAVFTGICFGIVGLGMAAVAGAVAGYLGTPGRTDPAKTIIEV